MTTNYEKIKNMNIDEMVEMFAENHVFIELATAQEYDINAIGNKSKQECIEFYKQWLEEECEDDN